MLIITGSSPKRQILGHRDETCHACRQVTSHRLERQYAVKHLFWFPLFSMGTTYTTVCERCNLFAQTSVPPAGSVPPAPFLHRMGFLFPIGGFVILPFLLMMPLLFVAGAGGTRAGLADNVRVEFFVAPADKAVQKDLQGQFDELDLSGLSVKATSGEAAGKTVRVIAAHFPRLKRVGDDDRVRLLQIMEDAADESFPEDEVFVGLQGRILWGGYSHRVPGQEWRRKVDESTDSPERNAEDALRALTASASKAAAEADARVAAAN